MRKDAKKKVPWLLLLFSVLIVMLLSGCGAENGSQTEMEIAEEDLSDAMDVCASPKNYYVAAADKVLVYDSEGNPGKVYTFPERIIAQIAYGDALYALDMQEQSIVKLDKDGKAEGEYKLDFTIANLIDFEAVDANVYLSVGIQEGEMYEECTYVLPWKEQKMTKMLSKGAVMANAGSLLVYQDGQVIGYEVSDRSETDGENYGSLGNGFGSALTSFCVDTHNRYYYCTDLKVIKEEDGTTEYLHRMDTDYDAIATCGDTILLLKRFERLTLATKKAHQQEYEQTLTLYGVGTTFDMPDGTHRDLAEEFEEKNNVGVERISGIGMNQETFLTNLMSGSDKYDIYSLAGVDETAFNYVKNHAYVDLSVNSEIVEKMEQWYGPLVEGCTYQGELFAVPGGSSEEVLYCNTADYPELMQEDFSTWDSFLDVIEKYDKEVQFNETRLVNVLLEQYIATYCDTLNGEYQFDTEAFRKVLQLLRRIKEMDIRYYQGEGYPELFENGEMIGFESVGVYAETGMEFLPLPAIYGEEPISPVKLRYNIINPNSERTEVAMEYVSMLAECGTYARKDTAEQFPLIADLYENHARCVFGSHAEYGTALENYVNGTMTEEEAIAEITELTRRKQNQ